MPIEGVESKDVRGFVGVNIRIDRTDLAETQEGVIELRQCVNADKHTRPHTIFLRKGRAEQFSDALGNTTIRRLGKFNDIRYQVASTQLYRNQTAVGDYRSSTLDGTRLHTTMVGFKPLNDTAIWTFVADRGKRMKDDGTNTRVWGLAVPATYEVAQQQSGSYTYNIGVTHIRFDGTTVAHESNPTQVTITESA